jgi:arylsulfatase A-like enzyme/Tfp pilus assembly protein PilF
MKKRIAVISWPVLGIMVLTLLSPGQAMLWGRNHRPNVLLITMDTTRADRLGIYGYTRGSTPNLDAIGKSGVVFDAAFSQAPITLPSHCSIMTGTSIPHHKVRSNGKYQLPTELDTLAEILKRQGYHTAAFISSFVLDSRFGLNQGFDVYNQEFGHPGEDNKTRVAERKAAEVFQAFSQWFKKTGPHPFFCFVHFYDPHEFYKPPEPYYSRFKKDLYDGEIAYMDEYVGKIAALLESRGVLRDTLVVILGDHGEAFGEHGEWGHQFFCYEENLRVPLLISGRGLPQNKRVSARVDVMDVAPTIADYLGISLTGDIQGVSLLPLVKSKTVKKRGFYLESIFANEAMGCAGSKGWVEEGFKYIDLPRPELYDLASDPGEHHNLFLRKNYLARNMKQKMKAYLKRFEFIRFNSSRALNPTEIKRLESLGYISSAGKTAGKPHEYPDPKDKVTGWSFYVKGQRLLEENKHDEARRNYEEAIRLEPHFSWPYARLAAVHQEKGNIKAADQTFKQAMAQNPTDDNLKIDYARFLVSQTEIYDAFVVLKQLEKTGSPEIRAAANLLKGKIFLSRDDYKEALYCFKEVLNVEPDNFFSKKMVGMCLFRTGQMAGALEFYQPLDNPSRPDPDILFTLAMAANRVGKHQLSASYYERLLKIDSAPPIYFNYALVLASLNKWNQAAAALRKFLAVYPDNDARKRQAQQLLEDWTRN